MIRRLARRVAQDYNVQTTSKLVPANATETDSDRVIIESDADPMLGPNIAAAYSEVAKDFIGYAAVTIGVTYTVCKIVGRLCR